MDAHSLGAVGNTFGSAKNEHTYLITFFNTTCNDAILTGVLVIDRSDCPNQRPKPYKPMKKLIAVGCLLTALACGYACTSSTVTPTDAVAAARAGAADGGPKSGTATGPTNCTPGSGTMTGPHSGTEKHPEPPKSGTATPPHSGTEGPGHGGPGHGPKPTKPVGVTHT